MLAWDPAHNPLIKIFFEGSRSKHDQRKKVKKTSAFAIDCFNNPMRSSEAYLKIKRIEDKKTQRRKNHKWIELPFGTFLFHSIFAPFSLFHQTKFIGWNQKFYIQNPPPMAFFSALFIYSSTWLPQKKKRKKKQRKGKPLCCSLFLYSRLKIFEELQNKNL